MHIYTLYIVGYKNCCPLLKTNTCSFYVKRIDHRMELRKSSKFRKNIVKLETLITFFYNDIQKENVNNENSSPLP